MQLKNVGSLLMMVVPKLRTERTGLSTPDASRFYCSGCDGLADSRFYDRRMY